MKQHDRTRKGRRRRALIMIEACALCLLFPSLFSGSEKHSFVQGFSFLKGKTPQKRETQQVASSWSELATQEFQASTAASAGTDARQNRIYNNMLQISTATNRGSLTDGVYDKLDQYYSNLGELYNKSTKIKCPFFRRRAADSIDALAMVLRFLLIRHKSLPLPGCTLVINEDVGTEGMTAKATRSQHNPISKTASVPKRTCLTIQEIASIVEEDWCSHNAKGYYITGRLNATIYRDDCVFDGPDPDMPVRGLRKYTSASSQLFDQRVSHAMLLHFDEDINHDADQETTGASGAAQKLKIVSPTCIQARWRLKATLRLPWKPSLPALTGVTTYTLDPDTMLICRHDETWDIHVLQAFYHLIFPEKETTMMRAE